MPRKKKKLCGFNISEITRLTGIVKKIIGPYIADFYCKALKLVIEIDGSQHYEEENMDYDKKRTEYFESLGIEVIRFTNTDIKKRLRYVCDHIDNKVAAKQMLR